MTLYLIILFSSCFVSFLIGRFVFLKRIKSGGITTLMPQRTIKARDFKADGIYKAMASRLKREGEILVLTEDPKKIREEIARNLKINPLEIIIMPTENKGMVKFIYQKMTFSNGRTY